MRQGFDGCRLTSAQTDPSWRDRLEAFIADNHHASMVWMEETRERRADPRCLWPEAKSIIMLAMNYGPDANPLDVLTQRERGGISVYARNRDYHDVIKGRLKIIGQKMVARAAALGIEDASFKVFVDTAPLMEKPLAHRAGLGWQGKHTNLVSRDLGSWFFLAAILVNVDLPLDDGEIDHCGSCPACLDICPTNAFPAPYQLDARRCISYLTIEHDGPVDRDLRAQMGNHIYGCDDCLAACPWNKFAHVASEAKLQARDDLRAPKLAELARLDDAAFRTMFSGSPIKRIGRDRFVRNVLIAIGNSDSSALIPDVRRHLADDNPVVRGAAVWALSRLVEPQRFQVEAITAMTRETDAEVLDEWIQGVGTSHEGATA